MINRPENIDTGTRLSYLALGDSYTIGESVELKRNLPYQLVAQLKASGLQLEDPKIIAQTGWTTGELKSAITKANITQKFDLVTLLIGVNNQYRGNSKETYRTEFKELLQRAIAFANGNKNRVFVVSIPDWGVTPFGKNSGRDQNFISAEIDAFNAINREETWKEKISYTDITPHSRKADTEPNLVAPDGLHPSATMYLNWAEKVKEATLKALSSN